MFFPVYENLRLLPFVAALFCASISSAEEFEKPRPEVREKLQKAKREIKELKASGHYDEAKRLEERVRDEMAKQGGNSDRMQHIKEAIKHLRAAGLDEQAERIERLAREHQEKNRERGQGESQGEGMEQMQRAMREAQEQTQRSLKETHEQMAKMMRAIEELREQVGKRQ